MPDNEPIDDLVAVTHAQGGHLSPKLNDCFYKAFRQETSIELESLHVAKRP